MRVVQPDLLTTVALPMIRPHLNWSVGIVHVRFVHEWFSNMPNELRSIMGNG